jgi:hypothetical protein
MQKHDRWRYLAQWMRFSVDTEPALPPSVGLPPQGRCPARPWRLPEGGGTERAPFVLDVTGIVRGCRVHPPRLNPRVDGLLTVLKTTHTKEATE